jgi:hypothetical protein
MSRKACPQVRSDAWKSVFRKGHAIPMKDFAAHPDQLNRNVFQ